MVAALIECESTCREILSLALSLLLFLWPLSENREILPYSAVFDRPGFWSCSGKKNQASLFIFGVQVGLMWCANRCKFGVEVSCCLSPAGVRKPDRPGVDRLLYT